MHEIQPRFFTWIIFHGAKWLMGMFKISGMLGLFLALTSMTMLATSITTTAPGGDPLTGYQATPPTFSTTGTIRGHVMFKNGFAISSNRTVTWDADGVVNGPITFGNSSSTLDLKTDLRLGTTGKLTSTVTTIKITGNGQTIILGGDTTWGTVANQQIQAALSDLTIDGQGHTLTLTDAYLGVLTSQSILTLKNLTLVYNHTGSTTPTYLFSAGPGGKYILENVVIRCIAPAGVAVALFKGSSVAGVTFRGYVAIDSPNSPVILADGKSNLFGFTVDSNSVLYIGKNTELRLGGSGSYADKFTMIDKTSVLHFDGCTFYTGTGTNDRGSGLQLSYPSPGSPVCMINGGTVVFENKVCIFNKDYAGTTNTDMTKALLFGDGSSSANDVDVRVLGGAYVLVDGCINYNPAP